MTDNLRAEIEASRLAALSREATLEAQLSALQADLADTQRTIVACDAALSSLTNPTE